MATNSDETKVRLIAQGKDLWRVQVLLTDRESARIPERLREIKSELAAGFGVHDDLLEYLQLLSKKRTRNGILVEMQIRKLPLVAEAPKFRFMPETAADGTEFTDMIVEADLFPLDNFERPLTREKLETMLAQEGVNLACVNWGVINEMLRQMAERPQPLVSQVIARGTLPDLGQSSRFMYHTSDGNVSDNSSAWMGLAWVKEGELLLEINSATAGLKGGQNVFGRELQARRGIQSRLEAGDGVEMSPTGNQLRAKRGGLAAYSRHFTDRRMKEDSIAVPLKLRAEVLQVEPVTDSKVFKISYDYPAVILADVMPGSNINARDHLYIRGDIGSGSQIQCGGTLRIVGNVDSASITVRGHLAINGWTRDSQFHCDLTAHVDGEVKDCLLYAREIVAPTIQGGVAEALINHSKNSSSSGSGSSIQVNQRKFLENQQEAGVAAVVDLREQLALVTELFGPEITQQVTPDTVQLMLLRWLRRQKTIGISNYSFRDVQEYRTVLSLVPMLREQLAATGAELREITSQLSTDESAPAASPS